MLIGYMRVSKQDGSQTLDLQKDALNKVGIENIFSDLASGRKDDRPGLKACLNSLTKGDTLIVWKLDRLGRDMRHLVNTVDDLRQKGIGFKVLSGYGAEIDTTTANGRMFFGVFAALAEFERELISERTKAGLKAAKDRGRLGGRPRKMDRSMISIAQSAIDRGTMIADICRKIQVTSATFYSYINPDGSLKELGTKIMNGV
jgi:DNA invertase Pin-like site-specific DNA recombinase